MKNTKKIVAMLLIAIIVGTNIVTLPTTVIAAGSKLESQDAKTSNSNIEFNSYFEGGKHETQIDTQETANMYLAIKVKNNGYLKNGIVKFLCSNSEIDSENVKEEYAQKVTKDEIELKQINNSSEEIIVKVPVKMVKTDKVSSENFETESQVVFTGTYVDGNGKERKIEKTIKNKISYTAKITTNLTGEVITYLPYQTEQEKGCLVQMKVQTGIENNSLPFNEETITLNLPKVEGIKPTRVTVLSNQEKMQYSYDEFAENLTITAKNEKDKEGRIAWSKEKNEYFINCFYEGKTIMPITGKLTVKSELSAYGTAEKAQKEASISYDLKQNKGALNSFSMTEPKSMSKGTLYANLIANQKQDTPFEVTYHAQILDAMLQNQVEITLNNEKWIAQEGEEIQIQNAIQINKIQISKAKFDTILGKDGKIEIFTKNGEKLGELTSKEEVENYELDITNLNQNEVVLKTSKPITHGDLSFTVQKTILSKASMSKEQVQNVAAIILKASSKSDLEQKEVESKMNLTEPTIKAELNLETQSLSTLITNKDVEMRVVLDTSSPEYALFKNPSFEIEMPENIEKVELKDVDLFLEDELKVKDAKVVTKNGKQVILVTLEGTQTQYVGNVAQISQENEITQGCNLVIKADITLKKLAPSKTENIVMHYTNNNEQLYTQETANASKVKTAKIDIVAPGGIVTANQIYLSDELSIMNVTDGKQTIKINPYANAQTAKVEGSIVNNYANAIENIEILGRIPKTGNQKIDETEELGSNFDTTLKGAIQLEGIQAKVYYTTNLQATKDLNDKQNEWTLIPDDYSKVKSYLIVPEKELTQAGTINFTYEIEVPVNLAHNNSSYEMYKVYYDSKASNVTTKETKLSGIVGLTTGTGPELEVKLNSNVEKARVGQIVRFDISVKNIGKEEAKGVTVNIPVPAGTKYAKYDSTTQEYSVTESRDMKLSLGNLQPEQTASSYYELEMQADEVQKIENNINVTANELQQGIASNTYTLEKEEGKIVVTNTIPTDPNYHLNKGDILYATTMLEAQEDLENVVVTIPIPQGIIVKQAGYVNSNGETTTEGVEVTEGKVIAKIAKIEAATMPAVSLTLEIGDIKGQFSYQAEVTAQGIPTQYANELKYTVANSNFEITQSSTSKRYIKEAEQITYQFTIKNTGDADANNVVFEDILPEGLSFVKMKYVYKGENTDITSALNNTATIKFLSFEKGASCEITIIAKANLLGEDKKEKEVSNKASISASGLEKIESNTITNIVEQNKNLYQGENNNSNGNNGGQNGSNNNQNSNGNQQGNTNNAATSNGATYKITGTVWKDTNKNGQRDENEELLPDVKVMLLKKATNQIVLDKESNQNKIATTDKNGKYEFNGLAPDDYLVVFLYDNGKYSITEYQKEKVSQSYNSDARSMKITLNGKQTYAGVTDKVALYNENARDIDLGLYEAAKFDLKLDKSIRKITLTTPTIGTKTYFEGDSKIEKIDILGKNAGKSSFVVEYKIKVTNEGQVPGYVKKIVDYLPADTKFSSELNKDWYLSENQKEVYNTSLENEKINPGESKEVTLILSMQITEKAVGSIVNNNAEIYESYNEQGLKDVDSAEANKVEAEDDMSRADIVISVVTGKIVLYTTLIGAVLFLLTTGIIVIKKKVLYKRK